MKKRLLIPLALLCILVMAFLVAPVSAGLNVTDGAKITLPYGISSPVITITDSNITAGGIITIDIPYLYAFINSGRFVDTNVVITSNAAAATWTGAVSGSGDLITLTSAGGNTTVGENITVTFTGAEGNRWVFDTYGDQVMPLTVTRTDTAETASINFLIQTAPLPPGGLTVSDGAKITSPSGASSSVITITDSNIPQNGTIIIEVPYLFIYAKSGTFTDANMMITSNAASAMWTGTVSGVPGVYNSNFILLTSTGSPTVVGENITVTFTGAGGNPWVPDTFGEQVMQLVVARTDTSQSAYINFMIETIPPPGGLTVADGAKITTALGATSPVITIANTTIPADGTITLDISGLTTYVASGTLTDADVVINDTAAAATWTRAVAGNTLTLTSSGGATVVGENVTVTFTGAGGNAWIPNTHGEQTIQLTATRTDTSQKGTFNFVIETAPPTGFLVVANFTASPTSEMVPLTVTFTDTSLGSPTSWSWDINNDGVEDYTTRNPTHTYPDIGTYTVSLTATNAYGSDTITQWDYIKVLNGAVREANTAIPGLTITNCGSQAQTITVNTSILPAVLISKSVLEIQPPPDRGFKNIIMNAPNGVGFSREGTLITGNPTSVHLVSEDIAPSPGFSGNIGSNASFNYSVDLSSYPCNAILSTKIWEGVIPKYDIKIRQVLDSNNAGIVGTAYTARITKTNFPAGARAKVHMSVDSNWNPSLSGGPGMMFIWRISDDENSGQVLPTTYLYTDPVNNLDYHGTNSPSGLSTFGLSSITGNNNPFQIVAFVAQSVISQSNNPAPASGGGGGGAVQTMTAPETKQATPTDPGKTAKIYANDEGTITQVTTLQSTDGLANVSLGLGIVARNSSGMPLTSISITRIADLPAAPPKATLSYAGMAYEIKPDGATFSPAIPLSFTIPQGQWGKEYVIQAYDHANGTWQALPGSFNPETGIITTEIAHLCCFALFAKSTELPKAATPEPTIIISSKSAISTNVGMYSWIISFIVQNPVIIVIALAVLATVAYFGWRKRRL